MPLNLSFTHIMVVLVVALVVLGPERLPEAARTVAKAITELRRMSTGLQAEVRENFGEFAEPFTDLVESVKGGVESVKGEVANTAATFSTIGTSASPDTAESATPAVGPGQRWPVLGEPEPAAGTFSPGPR